MARKDAAQRVSAKRCAIYTRKSTEEGLDQSFNSLDAQWEACEAYITSQRHEGWTLIGERYDDGGFSGGNIERPGLVRLLADVEAGRVDVIVVYKVDRLTRSLADFAKIVEVLDDRKASFVSVTQAFNTTSSMGRLTLNVLLSFAQFEREVTGERIRDKVAASKAKGMWMGGNIPLGYDVVERKLVINEAEAAQVRHIFERYVALGGGKALLDELRVDGSRTKRAGDRGGKVFGRGPLYHLLNNRLYLGQICHREEIYPGQHEAIISQELWDAVQNLMGKRRERLRRGTSHAHPSLLVGKIFDGEGRRMSPSHAVKSGRRYRYYFTAPEECHNGAPPPWRIPAQDIENATATLLKEMLQERKQLIGIVGTSRSAILSTAFGAARQLIARLDDTAERRAAIGDIDMEVHLLEERVEIRISPSSLAALLIGDDAANDDTGAPILLYAPAVKARRGNETKLIIGNDHGRARDCRDQRLIDVIVEARDAYRLVLDNPSISIPELTRRTSKCRKRFYRLVRIAMLAPDIVQACVDGTQPMQLNVARLLETELPVRWDDQRRLLGFA